MKVEGKKRRPILILVGGGFLFVLLMALGFIVLPWIDRIPLRAATPPAKIKTLVDFRDWKGEEVLGNGLFVDPASGDSYQVLLAPAGRVFASGPSAYLFDSDGNFQEWTPDMGDVFTNRNDFDLSSGNLKRSGPERKQFH